MTNDDAKNHQRAMNPKTLATLIANNADVSTIHHIHNVFYVFSSKDVEPLCRKLQDNNFVVPIPGERLEYGGNEYWKIDAIVSIVPSQVNLDFMTDQCVDLAAMFGGEYDGWFTEVLE